MHQRLGHTCTYSQYSFQGAALSLGNEELKGGFEDEIVQFLPSKKDFLSCLASLLELNPQT